LYCSSPIISSLFAYCRLTEIRELPAMNAAQTRQKIQQQKELPTLSPSVQRILMVCEDPGASQNALVEVLGEAPTIAGRVLGLANSAFFGQQGGVHSLQHALAVLGTVSVRSIAAGLALSGVFDTGRCPAFSAERYWLSAEMTALLAQHLVPQIPAGVRPPPDSVYLAGLLHNIGLLALVHLNPNEMRAALDAYVADRSRTLGEHIRDILEIDHYQAGVWLGSKWHFPRDLLLVMEHHYNPAYRGDHWPLVLLEGLAARWANRIIDRQTELGPESEAVEILGLPSNTADNLYRDLQNQLDRVGVIAATFSDATRT
jgi:HD-like signal output (HDOD) protein